MFPRLIKTSLCQISIPNWLPSRRHLLILLLGLVIIWQQLLPVCWAMHKLKCVLLPRLTYWNPLFACSPPVPREEMLPAELATCVLSRMLFFIMCVFPSVVCFSFSALMTADLIKKVHQSLPYNYFFSCLLAVKICFEVRTINTVIFPYGKYLIH